MDTLATPQETADDAFPKKAALHMARSLMRLSPTNSQDDNKARRQDLKRQQRPMNPMQAVADEEEQIGYSDEDINQGF